MVKVLLLIALLIACLLVLVVEVWAWIAVFVSPRLPGWWRAVYLLCLAAAGLAAWRVTSSYTYYGGRNTRLVGWPIPRVIFQRRSADAPWEDFVGATVVLAYPMSFAAYIAVPSLLFLVGPARKARKAADPPRSGGQPLSAPGSAGGAGRLPPP